MRGRTIREKRARCYPLPCSETRAITCLSARKRPRNASGGDSARRDGDAIMASYVSATACHQHCRPGSHLRRGRDPTPAPVSGWRQRHHPAAAARAGADMHFAGHGADRFRARSPWHRVQWLVLSRSGPGAQLAAIRQPDGRRDDLGSGPGDPSGPAVRQLVLAVRDTFVVRRERGRAADLLGRRSEVSRYLYRTGNGAR